MERLEDFIERRHQAIQQSQKSLIDLKEELTEKRKGLFKKSTQVGEQVNNAFAKKEDLSFEISQLEKQLTEVVMSDKTEIEVIETVRELRTQLNEKADELKLVRKNYRNLKFDMEDISQEIADINGELANIVINNEYARILKAIEKIPANKRYVESFNVAMSSLEELCKEYSISLTYAAEVELDLSGRIFVSFLQLFTEDENMLTLHSEQIAAKFDYDFLKEPEYTYSLALQLSNMDDLYQFFHFIPKAYIHIDTKQDIERNVTHISNVFIYQPKSSSEKCFIHIGAGDQTHLKKEVLDTKMIVELSKNPTMHLGREN